MKTNFNVSNPLNHGMSRAAVIVLVAALGMVCVLGLVGFKFRQTRQPQLAATVPAAMTLISFQSPTATAQNTLAV